MYRKLVIGVLSVAAVPSFALANRKYGMAGCGLGSVVMGRSGSQVSAWTTNGSFNSRIFGITTGTSNCVADRRRSADVQQENFMFNNYATLSREMAQGNGSTLAGLAEVLGCSPESKTEFNNFAQENHKQVFAAPGAVAALNTFKESLSKNETLARNCGFVAAVSSEETK